MRIYAQVPARRTRQVVADLLALADQVYLLNKGSVVFTGPPAGLGDDLFAHYLGTAGGAH